MTLPASSCGTLVLCLLGVYNTSHDQDQLCRILVAYIQFQKSLCLVMIGSDDAENVLGIDVHAGYLQD